MQDNEYLSLGKAAKALGATAPTFLRWADAFGLKCERGRMRGFGQDRLYRTADVRRMAEWRKEIKERNARRQMAAIVSREAAMAALAAPHGLRMTAASGCGVPKGCIIAPEEWRLNPDTGLARMVASAKADPNNPPGTFYGPRHVRRVIGKPAQVDYPNGF